MFGLGWGEIVVIGIVALIAIGPKELPTVLRTLAQSLAKIRRMAAEFQGQFQEALREVELTDLKKQAEDLTSSVGDISNFDPLADTQKEMERAFEMPEEGKTPEATSEAAGEVSGATAADTSASTETATPAAETAAVLPAIDVALPDAPAPVTEKDFAAVEPPPPKQAGGSA